MSDKDLTIEKSMSDFQKAYAAKRKLIEREKEDHLFALGVQWDSKDVKKLEEAGVKPITDNRIQPLIFLVTGLQRQNRTEFKAFPEGEEDGIKAEIASALFKSAINKSKFNYKVSDQFKNGVTCGESNLELAVDYTENLLNGKPCWYEVPGNRVFPDPGAKEYDYSDGRYVYKITPALSRDELVSLYPEKERQIEKASGDQGRIKYEGIVGDGVHRQPKDYPRETQGGHNSGEKEEDCFDLIERQYKKWVDVFFIGDNETGEIKESPDKDKATEFVTGYQAGIESDQMAYEQAKQDALRQHMAQMAAAVPGATTLPMEEHVAMMERDGTMPIAPPPRDPARYKIIKRRVPEIWIFAHCPAIKDPLAHERAWFYPKWKAYGIIPYVARFSTAPLDGEERHLLIQGITHGLKGVQEKHNKAEMLMLRHLNTAGNSGWDVEEGQVIDENKLRDLGSSPGAVITRKAGSPPLNRLFPMPLSQGHAQIAAESAAAIPSQSGINPDLLALEKGGTDSGRAIALRTKQGLVMVQELFDNLSRTIILCGQFLLSQLGDIFDTESAMKVLGEGFLAKNFPPPMQLVPGPMGQPVVGPDGMPAQEPMVDPKTGQPMKFDREMAEVAIAEVLSGDLGRYDVSVGEAVASDTMKMANSQEVKDIAAAYPGLIPPEVLIEESQLSQSTKNRILSAAKNAQALAAQGGNQPPRVNKERAA